jgi:hypothetical protein
MARKDVTLYIVGNEYPGPIEVLAVEWGEM